MYIQDSRVEILNMKTKRKICKHILKNDLVRKDKFCVEACLGRVVKGRVTMGDQTFTFEYIEKKSLKI